MKRAAWLLLLLLSATLPAAEQDVYPSASVGSRWLNVPGSARVAALAGAFAARSAEPGGLEANPASLAGLTGWQTLFTHNAWIEGMSVERLVGAAHLGCWGGAALQVDYLNLGQVDRYTLDASGQPRAAGTSSVNSYAVAGAWAGDWGPLSVGACLRGLGENLATGSSGAFEGDLGLRYAFDSGWRAGLAARNLGLDFSPALRPLSLRGGAGYTFEGSRPLALDLNTDYQTQDGEPPTWRLAAEWAAFDALILRAGWLVADANQPHGPTAGAGWLTPYGELDYALYAAGDIGLSHLITLRITGWGTR